MRTAADAIRPVVIVGRGLQRLRGGVTRGMGGHRRSRQGSTAEAGQRRRGGRGRSSRASLRKVSTNMGRNRSAAHVVIGTRHVQRREVTSWRDRMMRRRGSRVYRHRTVLREHPLADSRPLLILSEIGFGLRRGLFDRTRVMVLVTSQCSATSESLLAVRIGTLVRPFPGVNSAVPGQRRRIAKRLIITRLLELIWMGENRSHTFPHRSHMCGFSPV